MSIAVHSPSGWPFGSSSKERKEKLITVKHDNEISHSISQKNVFPLCTLTYFIDVHSPLSHIVFD